MSKIFVSIAAYRDPELLPTLQDLIINAANPNDLVICIAWQHSKEDKWDTLKKYKKDPRFKIIDIPYKESQGVCWARNQVQQQNTRKPLNIGYVKQRVKKIQEGPGANNLD